MLGAIIGDIAGSRFEFEDFKSKDFDLFGNDGVTPVRCQYTDDSVMTVAVADTLLGREAGESDRAFKQRLIINMHYHGRKRMNAGYGTQFYCWLRDAKTEPYNSWGNGSAMRVSPVGLYAATIDEALRLAEVSAAVTHNHPEGIKGAQAVAVAVLLNRIHGDRPDVRQMVKHEN